MDDTGKTGETFLKYFDCYSYNVSPEDMGIFCMECDQKFYRIVKGEISKAKHTFPSMEPNCER